MKRISWQKIVVSVVLVCIMIFATACQSKELLQYYSKRDNYISATGTISDIHYSDEFSSFYISFSDLKPSFDDSCFKICGDNYAIVKGKGIEERIKAGDSVEFIAAPKYFGDGYVMPIVSITIDGQTLLEADEGISNLLKWLERE